jgi:transcriptional regulator with XRE-family HTH domain
MPVNTSTMSCMNWKEDIVRKIQLNGGKIKELRDSRDRGSTQKEFAHEIRISERRLRAIENKNASVSAGVAEHIARAFNTPLQLLTHQRDDGPPSPAQVTSQAAADTTKPVRREQLLPRFDEAYAQAVGDEAQLFDLVKGNRSLVSHILTSLNAETSAYGEELISILRSLTWEARDSMDSIDGAEEIGLRRRIRELLVLLKGNDVWVYADTNMKALPESFEVRPQGTRCDYEFQAVIALGPPGEYGEASVKVPIDRGQPSVLTW